MSEPPRRTSPPDRSGAVVVGGMVVLTVLGVITVLGEAIASALWPPTAPPSSSPPAELDRSQHP